MTSATTSNKRRRTFLSSPPTPRRIISLRIGDLPDEALSAISKFLPHPSQALFAAAMTAPSSSWREARWKGELSATSKAIVSLPHQDMDLWTTLDFADVEYALARALTDDDIAAALASIDAPANLKSLKLAGCIGITGRCLAPLRKSVRLEQLDLSLVGKHESPNIWPEPRISESAVLTVLDGMINRSDGMKLRQLQLPKKFRSSPSPEVEAFVERFDELLEHQGGTCSKCKANDFGHLDCQGRPWIVDDVDSPFYGLQNFTCFECKEHRCMETCLGKCSECEKAYCSDCVPTAECARCPNGLCAECGDLDQCDLCNDLLCGDCSTYRECCGKTYCEKCIPVYECEFGCGAKHCSCCFSYHKGNDVEKCVGCGTRACSRCRFVESKRNPEGACGCCTDIVDKVQRLCQGGGKQFI